MNPNVNTARTKNSRAVVEHLQGSLNRTKVKIKCVCFHTDSNADLILKTNLYLMSKRVESSSSSFSSLRGAISTRSAGVVMMSYLRVFLILLPDLWEEKNKTTI